MKAVNENKFKVVRELLNNNLDYNFNIKNREGRTLLDITYTRNRRYETGLEEKALLHELKSADEYAASKDIFMLLLDNLSIYINSDRTKNNKTLLHIAIEQNAPTEDIVMFILMGANLNLKDSQGKTAWEYELLNNPDKTRNDMRYRLLRDGLHAASLPELAKCIGIEKLRQLSNSLSLPESNKQTVKELLKIAEQHQQPTPLNPHRQ